MVSKAIPVDEALSQEVLQFAQQHGIVEYVEKAMKAAREVFADGERVMASVKRDPEYGDLYVEVHVVLHAHEEPETAAEKDSECIGKWVSFLPPQVDNIRLSSSWAS